MCCAPVRVRASTTTERLGNGVRSEDHFLALGNDGWSLSRWSLDQRLLIVELPGSRADTAQLTAKGVWRVFDALELFAGILGSKPWFTLSRREERSAQLRQFSGFSL